MGLLDEISNHRHGASMTLDQATQMLGWVNGMLSKNLYAQERERFFAAKQYLEGVLANQQHNQTRSLLTKLTQRQNPNLFLVEGIVRGPGIPEGGFSREDTALDLIHPDDYRKPLDTIIRNIRPNPFVAGDRIAIDPGRLRQWRYGGI